MAANEVASVSRTFCVLVVVVADSTAAVDQGQREQLRSVHVHLRRDGQDAPGPD